MQEYGVHLKQFRSENPSADRNIGIINGYIVQGYECTYPMHAYHSA